MACKQWVVLSETSGNETEIVQSRIVFGKGGSRLPKGLKVNERFFVKEGVDYSRA